MFVKGLRSRLRRLKLKLTRAVKHNPHQPDVETSTPHRTLQKMKKSRFLRHHFEESWESIDVGYAIGRSVTEPFPPFIDTTPLNEVLRNGLLSTDDPRKLRKCNPKFEMSDALLDKGRVLSIAFDHKSDISIYVDQVSSLLISLLNWKSLFNPKEPLHQAAWLFFYSTVTNYFDTTLGLNSERIENPHQIRLEISTMLKISMHELAQKWFPWEFYSMHASKYGYSTASFQYLVEHRGVGRAIWEGWSEQLEDVVALLVWNHVQSNGLGN